VPTGSVKVGQPVMIVDGKPQGFAEYIVSLDNISFCINFLYYYYVNYTFFSTNHSRL